MYAPSIPICVKKKNHLSLAVVEILPKEGKGYAV